MMLQFKREEENLCGHRGLLPGCDQQTYTILVPKNLRLFYERLITPIGHVSRTSYHSHHQTMKSDQNFEKMILTYHNINRFLAAFIDHVRNSHCRLSSSRVQVSCYFVEFFKLK